MAESRSGDKPKLQEFGPWKEVCSSSGKIYYYNSLSEVSQWDKPQEWKDHDFHQEQQRLIAIEVERQKVQPVPPNPQPPPTPFSMPFPFPPPPNLLPNFHYGAPLPFPIPGTPSGYPGAPPPLPPPRNLPAAPPLATPNIIPPPPAFLQDVAMKPPPVHWQPNMQSGNSQSGAQWTYGQPGTSFNPMQSTHSMTQSQQRPGLVRPQQNYRSQSTTQRYDRPDLPKPEEQKPHPYAIPQALTPRDTSYTNKEPVRKAEQPRMDVQNTPIKREADAPPMDNEVKRVCTSRCENEIKNEVKEEPMEEKQVDDQPWLKYVDDDSLRASEELRRHLNLDNDQGAFNIRMDYYLALHNANDTARKKVLESQTFDVILHSEVIVSEMKIENIRKRRKIFEQNPIRPKVFDNQEERIEWLNSRLKAMEELKNQCESERVKLREKHLEEMAKLDQEEEEMNRRAKEEKDKRMEESKKRLQMSESERNKAYIEMAAKGQEALKKLEKKIEEYKRLKLITT